MPFKMFLQSYKLGCGVSREHIPEKVDMKHNRNRNLMSTREEREKELQRSESNPMRHWRHHGRDALRSK